MLQFLHQMFNVSAFFAAGRRTQAGDATDQWRDHWNAATYILDISQSSVATHLRCGGIFSDSIIANSSPILTVK